MRCTGAGHRDGGRSVSDPRPDAPTAAPCPRRVRPVQRAVPRTMRHHRMVTRKKAFRLFSFCTESVGHKVHWHLSFEEANTLSSALKPHVHWKCAGVRAKLGAFRRSVRAISEISALPAARAAPATPPQHASPPARGSEPYHPMPPLQRPTDLRCLSPQVSLVVRSYRGRDVPAREHLTSG